MKKYPYEPFMIKDEVHPREEETRKAMIIGISKYNDEHLRHLDFCRKNGEEMYKVLISLGYEIEDKHRLIGEVKFTTMREAISEFLTSVNIQPNITLLFYFSGYGIPSPTGEVYLVSSDTDPDIPMVKGVSLDEVSRLIERSHAENVVTILDCCFSTPTLIPK